MKNLIPFSVSMVLLLAAIISIQSCEKRVTCRENLSPLLKHHAPKLKGARFCTDLHGYPYEVDNIVIDFDDTVPQARIDALIALLQPDDIDSCICSPRLQNWKWNAGQVIDIEETVSQVSGQSRGEGSGDMRPSPNYLNYLSNHELVTPYQDVVFPSKGDSLSNIGGTETGKLIAILDTGLDPHYAIDAQLSLNNKPITDCLPTDAFGWNFITETSNISDDHGHGTAVAGIIAESLELASTNNEYSCGARFIILKTLDSQGTGNLFDAVCALDLAREAGASIINVSWGYYGHDIPMMLRMIRAIAPSIVVASLGNDTAIVDQVVKHFPSEYAATLDNVIAAAGDTRASVWESLSARAADIKPISVFSNFTVTRPMITAASVDISVWAPYNAPNPPGRREGTGTSYSAAFLSAAAAINQCCFSTPALKPIRATSLETVNLAAVSIEYRNIVLESFQLCDSGS